MIKNTIFLFSNWNFMRLLRLGLGVYIGIQAFLMHDLLSGAIAVFFLFQAVTNTGCCRSGGCAVPNKNGNEKITKDTQYTDVK